MNILVTLEHHFEQTPDGAVWTQTTFPHSFWKRYLEVFENVRVVARVRAVDSVSPDYQRADGDRVSFIPLPDYVGLKQYLSQARQVEQTVKNAFVFGDAIIMRVSSQIANHLQPILDQHHYPYGVEVVADPYDVFAPNSVKHPLRPVFRLWFPRQLRRQCAGACAAAYVTEKALQHRYPPAKNAFSTHYSSVDLPDEVFVSAPRIPKQEIHTFTIISVGTLAQLYKAPDVLIDAVAHCVQEGMKLKLVLVGDGKHRQELETRAAKLGLKECVDFRGQLPAGDAVRAALDQADLFVLPSHQEGLPRAMIEAMARGLPCIGSTVGGFPELIPPEDMVAPGNVTALAQKIREVVINPQRLAQMSTRNLQKAREYTEQVLRQRRFEFYLYLCNQTETWLKTHKP
ncbi:MAG TPA: glycosyltransferase family 4 protein [Trichormus sp. M33_DOE_039]|nr:glycosyltransferase family 4 protein [Trichormus sp. M33_DOE_039]